MVSPSISAFPSTLATPHALTIASQSADQAMPDGRLPNGKRPRAAESVTPPTPGQGPGALSTVELTTAVLQSQPAMMKNTQDAIHWNCDLLNPLELRPPQCRDHASDHA